MITTVVSDFGGVLTTPLGDALRGVTTDTGLTMVELGAALEAIEQRIGANPIFELETGRLAAADFDRALAETLRDQTGRVLEFRSFGPMLFAHLRPNEPMIDLMRELRGRGFRVGLCTNNVREWEQLWRPMLPVAEIFETVVDSGFVGHRKPDPEIYALTLDRLGAGAGECLFVDDMELNCDAARAAGMQAVRFTDNDTTIAAIEAALAGG